MMPGPPPPAMQQGPPRDANIVGPDMPSMPTDEELSGPTSRKRPQPIALDEAKRTEIAQRVLRFYKQDTADREHVKRLREQLYAKLMRVQTPTGDGSNVQMSDILAVSLRMEDQIQNSVMSTRPIMNSRALKTVDKERERKADVTLDYQFFVEQSGEAKVQTLSTHFFRQGQMIALVNWVAERRKIQTLRTWPAIPFGTPPRKHFQQILDQAFGQGKYSEVEGLDGWDWDVTDGKMQLMVRFYTDDDGEVEMETSGDPLVFEGPCVLPVEWEDILAPMWAENLQPPGPSNPRGAPHVILVDYPTKDEIIRGIEAGFYDLAKETDLAAVSGFRDWTDSDRELARMRHEIRGEQSTTARGGDDPDHGQLRRLLCFDTWKGLDVVWWVLQGPDILLRARPLTEVCPGMKPVRPIAHSACIEVEGTWMGMGIPELMESDHDFDVTVFNQMIDAAAFEITPFFKYRQSSNLKPEDIQIIPGRGIPMQNPQTDMIFERIQAQATTVGSNLLAISQQNKERLTLVGDLQVGQIPAGKSAALRTSGGIQQVLAQGEARPERMLRRFFHGMRQIFAFMYQLDRHFLSDEKTFRIADGVAQPGEEPFVQIKRASDLADVTFDFQASVLNSSKVAQQTSLQEMLTLLGSPLMMQMGISTPDSIYRILVDYFKALGQNPEKYLNKPSPMVDNPPIFAAEALTLIMAGQTPAGPPAEGDFEKHKQAFIMAITAPGGDGIPLSEALSMEERQAVALYIQQLDMQAMQAQQQFALMQAAEQFQKGQQQRPEAGGAGPKKPSTPQISGGAEQVNDTLPMGTGTPQ